MNKFDIENLMEQVPTELPEAVDEWIIKTCLGGHHYMFYDKKSSYAFCTSCRKRIDARYLVHQYAKHGEKDTCPECGDNTEFICIGRFRGYNMKQDIIQYKIMQPMPEGILIRRFEVMRVCSHEYRIINIKYSQIELQRQYNDGAKPKNFRAFFPWEGPPIWRESKKTDYNVISSMGYRKYIDEFEYAGNIDEALNASPLKYAKRGEHLFYYSGWIKQCEYLEKMKLDKVVLNIIGGYRVGLRFKQCRNIQSFLGVSKEDLNNIIKFKLDMYDVNQIKRLYKMGINKIDYRNIKNVMYVEEAHKQARKYSKISFLDFYKYVASQKDQMRTYRYYTDYLNYCEKNGYTMDDSVLFPKDIQVAHDREVDRFNAAKNEAKTKAIQEQFEKYMKTYGFETADMMIRPPKDAVEILKEGRTLSHCVGSYVDQVCNKETTILFLRKLTDPDKPFYTVEWNKGLKQIRGEKNIPPTLEVAKFVEQWVKNMNKPKRRQKQASMAM